MNTVTFDTHAAIRKLQDADLSERWLFRRT